MLDNLLVWMRICQHINAGWYINIKTDIIHDKICDVNPAYYTLHHVHPLGEFSFHFKKGTPYETQTHPIYPLLTYYKSSIGNCERNCTPIP